MRWALTFALLLLPFPAFAQSKCDASARSDLEQRAEAGEPKAQYQLGVMLDTGECGTRDPDRAAVVLAKAANAYYPPALHIVSVILRREGKDTEAARFVFAAASRGLRVAQMDMGLIHSEPNSPVRNDVVAYAWLAFVEAKSSGKLKEMLAARRTEVQARLSPQDRERAEAARTKVQREFGDVPEFKD